MLDWDDYERMIEENDLGERGAGEAQDCRNLKEAGWKGYDSDKAGSFEQVNPADLGIIDP